MATSMFFAFFRVLGSTLDIYNIGLPLEKKQIVEFEVC